MERFPCADKDVKSQAVSGKYERTSGCGAPRRSRRTRCSIVEREVVGLEEEMKRRFGYGGRYVDAHVSARCLCR